jgi:hypothetical protein
LSSWGEVIHQGCRPSVRPFVLLKRRVFSPLGVNEGVNIPPRDQSSYLEAKLTPSGKLKMLKTGLRVSPTVVPSVLLVLLVPSCVLLLVT